MEAGPSKGKDDVGDEMDLTRAKELEIFDVQGGVIGGAKGNMAYLLVTVLGVVMGELGREANTGVRDWIEFWRVFQKAQRRLRERGGE